MTRTPSFLPLPPRAAEYRPIHPFAERRGARAEHRAAASVLGPDMSIARAVCVGDLRDVLARRLRVMARHAENAAVLEIGGAAERYRYMVVVMDTPSHQLGRTSFAPTGRPRERGDFDGLGEFMATSHR